MSDHHEEDDLAPTQTTGYKPGEKKSLQEYQTLDAQDESLNKWKESLGLNKSAGASKCPKMRPIYPPFFSQYTLSCSWSSRWFSQSKFIIRRRGRGDGKGGRSCLKTPVCVCVCGSRKGTTGGKWRHFLTHLFHLGCRWTHCSWSWRPSWCLGWFVYSQYVHLLCLHFITKLTFNLTLIRCYWASQEPTFHHQGRCWISYEGQI